MEPLYFFFVCLALAPLKDFQATASCNPASVADIDNGEVVCTNQHYESSVCTYSCNGGFTLSGNPSVTCQSNLWEGIFPYCINTSCPAINNLTNGVVSCTNKNYLNSQCTFQCNSSFVLQGTSHLQCVARQQWNNDSPTCLKKVLKCEPPMTSIFSSGVVCSDGNNLGSICDVECREFDVDGKTTFTCVGSNEASGVWNRTEHSCSGTATNNNREVNTTGGELARSNNSEVITTGCQQSNLDLLFVMDSLLPDDEFTLSISLVRSVVNGLSDLIWFGYVWLGVILPDSTCTSTTKNEFVDIVKLGKWEDISLLDDHLRNFSLSGKGCSNYADTFQLSGKYVDDEGRSTSVPVIVFFISETLEFEATEELDELQGKGIEVMMLGTGGADKTQLENLADNKNHVFVRNSTAGLVDETDNIVDFIKIIKCSENGCTRDFPDFENGKYSCSYIENYGNVCEFECDTGLQLKGKKLIRCVKVDLVNEGWSSTPPVCTETQCPAITTLEHGTVTCTSNNEVGSKCAFRCNQAYFRRGADSSFCYVDVRGVAKWSDAMPACLQDLFCQPPLLTPENGVLSCLDGNRFNSLCTFNCNDEYALEGEMEVKCSVPRPNGDARWSSKPPSCKLCNVLSCKKDILITLDGGGFDTNDVFNKALNWTSSFVKSLNQSVAQGRTNIGVMQMTGQANLACHTGYTKKEIKIVLGLSSTEMSDVLNHLRGIEVLNSCSDTTYSLKKSVAYFTTVGRSDVQRVLLLLTKDDSNHPAEETILYAEQEDVGVVTVKMKADGFIGVGKLSRDTSATNERIATTYPYFKYFLDTLLEEGSFNRNSANIKTWTGKSFFFPLFFVLTCM
ncbi:unnamed protein product [Clavelina lepadiformis]|uniref:Uncharacterized protein n=1 Tax=Clavelina lepadiformis TaxID=159417 RepID=A0ABP0EZC5_CLALP